MKPLGRKHWLQNKYKDKHNGRHLIAWWENVIPPSKKSARQAFKKEISHDLDEFAYDSDYRNDYDYLQTLACNDQRFIQESEQEYKNLQWYLKFKRVWG